MRYLRNLDREKVIDFFVEIELFSYFVTTFEE